MKSHQIQMNLTRESIPDERLGRFQVLPAVVAVPGRVLHVGHSAGEALAAHAALATFGPGCPAHIGLVDT